MNRSLHVIAQFERMRRLRMLAYGLVAAAGAMGLAYPPTVLEGATSVWSARACAGIWLITGLAPLISMLRGSLWGEFVMLRAMAFAVGVMALALFIQASDTSPILLVYGFLLSALGVLLWGWWMVVSATVRYSDTTKGGE